MKKGIQLVAVMGVMALSSLSVMAQENQEAAEARKDVAQAQKELKEAKTDSAADYKKFRAEADQQIRDNQVKIEDLKKKNLEVNKDAKERYDKKVMALEQTNNDLRLRINNSDKTKTTNWTSFKREFNSDMNNLWEAIKGVGKDSSQE